MSTIKQDISITPITACLVDESQYHDNLSTYFGPRFAIYGEALVYVWLLRISKIPVQWTYLRFYKLSNGGFYLSPRYAEEVDIEATFNNVECTLSHDAAGIIATMLALRDIVHKKSTSTGDALTLSEKYRVTEKYHALAAFSVTHAEVINIYRAID